VADAFEFSAFLESRGLSYQALLDESFDNQLVHAEIDWKAGLRWRDNALISVSTARVGRTSFAIDFQVSRNGTELACSARIVYVVVATDGSGKREIPPQLAEALGAPAPLRPLLAGLGTASCLIGHQRHYPRVRLRGRVGHTISIGSIGPDQALGQLHDADRGADAHDHRGAPGPTSGPIGRQQRSRPADARGHKRDAGHRGEAGRPPVKILGPSVP